MSLTNPLISDPKPTVSAEVEERIRKNMAANEAETRAREAERKRIEDEAKALREIATRRAAAQEIEDFKVRCLQSWIKHSGSEDGFEAEWPSMRAEWLKQKILEQEKQAQVATQKLYRENF
jgi:hypothetical protein